MDEVDLERVLLNLACNALAALPNSEGQLVIRALAFLATADAPSVFSPPIPPGQYLLIEVEDNGSGLASEQLAAACKPIGPVGARGLGLTSIRTLVERNDGYLRHARGPEAGTTVQILFPEARW